MVFVPSAYNGSIPHTRSDDGDEERRLLYVAMTRAKALLYLSCPLYASHGNGEKREPLALPVAPTPRLSREAGSVLPSANPGRDWPHTGPRRAVRRGHIQGHASQRLPRRRPAAGRPRARPAGWRRPGGPPATEAAKTAGPHHPGAQMALRALHGTETTRQTMDQAARFTVSALPGFVTAGAHARLLLPRHWPRSRSPRRGEERREAGGQRAGRRIRRPCSASLVRNRASKLARVALSCGCHLLSLHRVVQSRQHHS